ncbi:hypothetical protein [Thermophilibacter mediterraneus]|uniref:hypothetical protein n=1 Tax=Thermophilibacter mediterraneus TaxID=1871031 RepID=UPI0009314DBB|nr:hypothetical protein [Thermophilibacter mediterraneus]
MCVLLSSSDLLRLLESTPQGLTSADVMGLFGVSERVAQGRLRKLLAPGTGVERTREGRSFRCRLTC